MTDPPSPVLAVVVPCYNVKDHVLDVIRSIGREVGCIVVVDDKCPQQSGRHVEANISDPRVTVVYHPVNKGVGGAMKTGYRAALERGAEIIVKIDGDGQMDPRLIPEFAAPLLHGRADYAKGNRFYSLYHVRSMPTARLIGNAGLSFLTKFSSGYWSVFDPTNGYTAVHAAALRRIDLAKIDDRFFFETDMLIHLGGIRAVVLDVPLEAKYGDEVSNLKIGDAFFGFLWRHVKRSMRRIFYNYYLRDFSIASLNLFFGAVFFSFGVLFGASAWLRSIDTNTPASAGTVILAALPILLGFQMLLSFLNYDMGSEPKTPLQSLVNAKMPDHHGS